MAFALTGFKAFGVSNTSATRKYETQIVQLYITGTAADVALDFGTDAGTFWTAAQANTTYGAMATEALAALKALIAQTNGLLAVQSAAQLQRVQVAALTAAGQFTQVISNNRPNIALFANDGAASYVFRFVYDLKDERAANVSDLGATQ
jgi:hypothetical protein